MQVTATIYPYTTNYQTFEFPSVGSYEEVMRRIPSEDRKKIEAKMNALEELDGHLCNIKYLLDIGEYESLEEDAFYYALLGLKEGKMDPSSIARISDIETLRRQGIEFDILDPLELIEDRENLKSFLFNATGKHLHKEMLDQMIEKLKKLPQKDRFIMLFKPNHQKLKSDAYCENLTVSQAIERKQKVNIFNRIKDPEKPHRYLRMFASLELFDAVLQIKFGEERVKMNPVFGKSTVSQIECNGFTNSRDVCLLYMVPEECETNRLVTYPEADEFPCEENDFNYHDRYHVFVTSSTGSDGRILSANIGCKLLEYANANKENISNQDYAAIRRIRWNLIDMDFPKHYYVERMQRVKRGMFHEEHLEHLEISKLPLIQSLFQDLSDSLELFEATQILKKPDATFYEIKLAQEEIKNTYLKPFETKKQLQNTFRFVYQSIPQKEEFTEGINAHFISKKTTLQSEMEDIKYNKLNGRMGKFLDPDSIKEWKNYYLRLKNQLKTYQAVFA